MKPLMAVKLKNQILAIDPTLKVELKNIRVNSKPYGCSGFVTNESGSIVYVSTDHNGGQRYNDALYRTAKSTKDYTGGHNCFSNYENLARSVVGLLNPAFKVVGDKLLYDW